MEYAEIPVVDTHCHPFPPEQGAVGKETIRDATSVSLRGPSSPLNETMLLSRITLKQLARVLDCPADWDSVIEARSAIAGNDPAAYNALLFKDANIKSVLIDPGFPMDREITCEQFQSAVPSKVYEGYRVERFSKGISFHDSGYRRISDFLEAFLHKLDEEAAKPTTRFFKSVIAYRTGLAITLVSDSEAADAWRNHTQYGDQYEKTIRDYLFWHTARKAFEHGIQLQVHTGHTSQTNIWPAVNPILMTPLLNTPEMQEVSMVLVHGGYPYCTEAGYMTSVYHNISLDLSLMIPWSSIGVANRIHQTLEFAPTAKVMYGSDGIWVPELFWIGAINGRNALAKVLNNLVADNVLDEAESQEIAKDILYRNAERIYGLSDEVSV